MVTAIESKGLTKKFGEHVAVHDLNLNIQQSEIYGFLGLNGAGKTTTVRMLTGVLRPTSGTAQILGQPVSAGPSRLSGLVGVAFGDNIAPEPSMSVERYLKHFAQLHQLNMDLAKPRAMALLEVLRLRDQSRRRIGELSGGNRRKVELARALLHQPRVLFLDEPTRELDIPAKRAVWAFLRHLAQQENITIFLSSHDIHEIAALCTRIGVVRHGRMSWQGTPRELAADADGLMDALADLLEDRRTDERALPSAREVVS